MQFAWLGDWSTDQKCNLRDFAIGQPIRNVIYVTSRMVNRLENAIIVGVQELFMYAYILW